MRTQDNIRLFSSLRALRVCALATRTSRKVSYEALDRGGGVCLCVSASKDDPIHLCSEPLMLLMRETQPHKQGRL